MTTVPLSACNRESSIQNGTMAAAPLGGACYPNSNGYKGSLDKRATAGGDKP